VDITIDNANIVTLLPGWGGRGRWLKGGGYEGWGRRKRGVKTVQLLIIK
jgi:hypothetical protein